jgi:hypothetical protein
MTLEEIQAKSKRELRRLINHNFERSLVGTDEDRPALIAQAEFLMRELDRRHDSWISLRDFILEIIVIALIGWEIHMNYRAERLQTENFKEEKIVFDNLAKSSAATASTLTALSDTTQAMNNAVQEQLGLNYAPAVTAVYDTSEGKVGMIHVTNNSPTAISVYGYFVGDYDFKPPKPIIILPHGTEDLNNGPFYSEQKEKLHSTTGHFPLFIFFRTKNGDEYTIDAELYMKHSPLALFMLSSSL